MLRMDEHEKIRRAVFQEGLSRREVARTFHYGRNTIRKILASAEPPTYHRRQAAATTLDAYHAILEAWVADEVERGVPRKQRSNALKLHERLRAEHGFAGSVYPVRRWLRRRHRQGQPVFFPLTFQPAEEAQVDWGMAWVEIAGHLVPVHLFCLRLCYSRAAFVRAYPSEKLECFLDGHVRALSHFGGCPRRLACDNLRSAVLRVGRGRERKLNEHFLRLRAHYLFESRFCNVASGHEKGQVENLVKRAQSDFLAGCPSFADLAALNAHLEESCRRDLERPAPQSEKTRGALLEEERPYFLPLRYGDAEACVKANPFISKQSLVQFERNFYSAPVAVARGSALVKAFADRVEIWVGTECVARHARSWACGDFVLEYRHYLRLLERKPGGLANGRPFVGEPWGQDLERFREEPVFRDPENGLWRFVDLLLLFSRHGEAAVKAAVRECVRARTFSLSAVTARLEYVPPDPPAGALDVSRWPELAVDTDGVRPAAEYDAAFELTGAEAGEALRVLVFPGPDDVAAARLEVYDAGLPEGRAEA